MDSYLDPTTIAARLAEVPVQTQASDAERLRAWARDRMDCAHLANAAADRALRAGWPVEPDLANAREFLSDAALFDRAAAALEPAAWTKCDGGEETTRGVFILRWRTSAVTAGLILWRVQDGPDGNLIRIGGAEDVAAAKAAALAVGDWR